MRARCAARGSCGWFWRVDQLICRGDAAPSRLAAHGKQLARRRLDSHSFDTEATHGGLSRATGSASRRPRVPAMQPAEPTVTIAIASHHQAIGTLPGGRRQLPAARLLLSEAIWGQHVHPDRHGGTDPKLKSTSRDLDAVACTTLGRRPVLV